MSWLLSLQPDGRDYSKFIGMEEKDAAIGHPQTTSLERRDIPPQLATTLEHIVGQLDVITQVNSIFFLPLAFALSCYRFNINRSS